MQQKRDIIDILASLRTRYPEAGCALDFDTPFHLLVAVVLSAQCTDVRVNKVTEELFKVYDTPADFASADVARLESLIFSCGFYRQKAKSLMSLSRDIIEKYGGEVPTSFDDLTTLRGVGRKTANVVASEVFGYPGIAVDTHVFRVSRRLGLSGGDTPEKVERDLVALIPADLRSDAHHLLIFHGRYCCHSRKPDCAACAVKPHCVYITEGHHV